MPTSSRRKPSKRTSEPLDLADIERDPGFRGMLSFLDVSPADKAVMLEKRAEVDAHLPMGQSPMDQSPMGHMLQPAPSGDFEAQQPEKTQPPAGQSPMGHSPMGQSPMGRKPIPGLVPYIDVEGRGKRPLRICHTPQDGHTAAEQFVYQSLWNHARKHGRLEPPGSYLVDIGLSVLCSLLGSDHKNSKRWIAALQNKLAIEMVRPPDFRNAIPTRYRVFNDSQILERRRQAGMVWVVRTRAVRFVDLRIVEQLLGEQPMGQSPQLPTGQSPTASPFPSVLASSINQWLAIDDGDVRQIWDNCRRGTPDCTEEEVAWFCRSKEAICRSGRIDSPAGLLIRSVPKFFLDGGSAALSDYRRGRMREEERKRQTERLAAQITLNDPEAGDEERAWAQKVLQHDEGPKNPATSAGHKE